MIPKDGITSQFLIAAFRRRFWYFVLPFFAIIMAMVVYCIRAPKTYKSTATILIQPQEVPAAYVSPTVTSGVQSRLNAITEQIMSRSRLKEIINNFDLYPKIRAAGSASIAVNKMRKDTRLKFKGGDGPPGQSVPTAFEVSFTGGDPAKTSAVTNTIANLYIDYNFRLRAEQAAGTTKFLEREVERMKEALRQREEAVREFKEKYIGFLPTQIQNNYQILNQLQKQLDSINTTIQKTEDRKILIKEQLAKLDTLEKGTTVTTSTGQEPVTLEGLRQQLQTLQSRYSEKHPDVIRLKATIANLENQEERSAANTKSSDADSSQQGNATQRLLQVQKDDLLAQLRMIYKDILSLQKAREKTVLEIEKYRQRIESAPKIEQMFVDLQRDYNQANNNYQSLLQKKLQAELAENLERTQKGEQFTLLDKAPVPRKPFKPDIQKKLMMGLMLALGSGLGLAFLREYLDPAFWTQKEVESMLQLPVLVSIPIIQTDGEKRWSMCKKTATVCILVVMSSTLLFALFVLWKKNPTLLPL